MKKRYLTYAGIVSAVLLVVIFVGICMSSFPFPFVPVATTIDPVRETSVDQNNMMILTGTTSLPENTQLGVLVSSSPGASTGNSTDGLVVKTDAAITAGDGGRNRWRSVFDISDLQPGDYRVSLATFTVDKNYAWNISAPIATAYFTLGDAQAGSGTVHKKIPPAPRFLRINPESSGQTPGNLTISGITSLASGTPLAWNLYPLTNSTTGTTAAYSGTIPVTEGTLGINRWDIRPGALPTGRYRIQVTESPAGATSPEQVLSASAEFEVPAAQGNQSGTNGSAGFLTIDALPDVTINNVSEITGTTSLSAGSAILVEVYPASFETGYSFSTDAKETDMNRSLSGAAVFSGATGGVSIERGSNGYNLWSFRLETYRFSPGQYLVKVSNNDYDLVNHTPVMGNLSATRVFPVMGDTL
jgi:hypothetical protein